MYWHVIQRLAGSARTQCSQGGAAATSYSPDTLYRDWAGLSEREVREATRSIADARCPRQGPSIVVALSAGADKKAPLGHPQSCAVQLLFTKFRLYSQLLAVDADSRHCHDTKHQLTDLLDFVARSVGDRMSCHRHVLQFISGSGLALDRVTQGEAVQQRAQSGSKKGSVIV